MERMINRSNGWNCGIATAAVILSQIVFRP